MTSIHRHFLAIVMLTILVLHCQCVLSQSDDYDYVKEVLEEDNHDYGEEYYHEDDVADNLRRQQDEAQKRQMAEEERLIQEEANRIAAERERAFEKELAKMNEEQKKAAMRQKKRDSQVVKSVLKAARKNQHYAVLGIRNWDIKIPSRKIGVAGLEFTIPGVTLKQTTTKDIRKAYRTRAMSVHPDKNRDGHAQEAFIAVENSASILSDEKQRTLYDKEQQQKKMMRRHEAQGVVMNALSKAQSTVRTVFKAVYKLLGPFATPVLIIGALII